MLNVQRKRKERARKRLEAKSADIDIARAELALKRALVRKGLKHKIYLNMCKKILGRLIA